MFSHINPRAIGFCIPATAPVLNVEKAIRTSPTSAARTRVHRHPFDNRGGRAFCLATLTLSFGLIGLAAGQATAESEYNCAPREAVVDQLATEYGESRKSIGLGTRGTMVETYASVQTGTWTITITTPSGNTCLVASGQSWEALSEVMPAGGSDI